MKGYGYSFATLMEGQYQTLFLRDNWDYFETSYSSEEWSNYLEEYRRTIVLSLVELALRSVKISFGFVNSLVLIILLKPFHEPLIVIKTWIWKQFANIGQAEAMVK
ncbi:uncharacterized protein LOC142350999 [Convolutriloba macropyga]|uniref:uncharacterized protein LOC142350999 n=1 Tax=Convolutriloba macropyga TaxID=536237 RepID=UPI003F51E059